MLRNLFLSLKVLLSLTPSEMLLEASASTKEVVKVEIELLTAKSETSGVLSAFSLLSLLNTLFTLSVINSPLFRVTQDIVGICNFLELFFGLFRFVSVFVWVIFDGQLFECFLDLIFRCVGFNAHDLVIVFTGILWLLLLLLSLSTSMLALAAAKVLSTTKLLASTETLASSEIELKLLRCNTWGKLETSCKIINDKSKEDCDQWRVSREKCRLTLCHFYFDKSFSLFVSLFI